MNQKKHCITELSSILLEDDHIVILSYRLMDDGSFVITGLHAHHFDVVGPKKYSKIRQILTSLFHKDGGKYDPSQVLVEASKRDYRFVKEHLESIS